MRAFLSGIAALAFATLGACSPTSGALGPVDVDPAAVEAMAARLVSEPFKGEGKAAADLDALRTVLPKEIGVSWGNLSFEAATGATLVKDLRITPAGRADAGVSVSELRLWDLDVEAAKARFSGQRTSETVKLARRIDAKGIAGFGLAGFFNELVGAAANIGEPVEIAPLPAAPAPAQPPASDDWPAVTEPEFTFGRPVVPSVTRVDISLARVVLDDVMLRAASPPPAGKPTAPAIPESARAWLGFMSSLGVDAMAMTDAKFDMGMVIENQPVSMSGAMKSSGARGWRGADSDASFTRDLSLSIGVGEGGAVPAGTFDIAYGLITLEDSRLDRFQAYTNAGITPPVTETDLMSFGRYRTENGTWKLNGQTLMSVGEATIDARGFHWMMPSNISASARSVEVDIGAIMQLAAPLADEAAAMAEYLQRINEPPSADDNEPATSAPVPEIVAPAGPSPSEIIRMVAVAFEKNGMSKPNLSYDIGYTWNPNSGDARFSFGVGTDTFMKIDGAYEMGLPPFKDIAAVSPSGPTADPFAMGRLFDRRATLKSFELNLDDKGGLDRTYKLLADLSADLGPSLGGGMVPPGGMTAANLRMMAGGLVTMLGATPDLAPLFGPVGAFLSTGGKLHVEMKPPNPVPLSQAGPQLYTAPGGPGATLKQFGVKAEHTPKK